MTKQVIKSALLFGAGLWLTSCAHALPDRADITTIKRFADVEANLGKPVRIKAIYGDINEARGLYLSGRDFRLFDRGGQCLLYSDDTLNHGERVELFGTITDSGCGTELFCITVCQPYKFEALAE
ncbi:hypothetical protein MACH24_25490 [Erythrobacter sp. Dej080120_24]|uniref:hypothetical protein n=1 Tax=Erythrobacter sp. Dej080120_24 TaxID=3024837 RepID=UPI0004D4331C|nr:hypothetical protein EH30_08535 [Erythrobacter sp. JL475]BDW83111.1 hypothetical protein MACH24_25490 [Erythrobacter sp. Dej080120_24]